MENTAGSGRLIDEALAGRFMACAYVGAGAAGIMTIAVIGLGGFGFNMLNLVDVAIFFGLAFGVYRRSRVCAIALLVYHLANRVDMYSRTGSINTSFGLLAIAFAMLYVLGIVGTFAHHAMRPRSGSDVPAI
jgi:hypothetical protein